MSWLRSLAVFAGLAAIGWWGHRYHWSLPQLPAFLGSANQTPTTGPGDRAAPPLASAPTSQPALTNLPAVELASVDSVRRCGIETARAREQSMDDTITANGSVDYDHTHLAQLSVRAPGVVWRVEKFVGDAVQRDDVLAIIDSAAVGQAKADLLEAIVVFDLKTQNLKRLQSIEKIVPGRDLIQARADRQLAQAQRFNALQKLINLGFPLRMEDVATASVDELAKRLQRLGLPDSLQIATESTNLIPLVAPFSGIVTSCSIVRGETVDSSTTQYTLADTRRMWINLDVRQEHAGSLKLGAPIVFTSEVGGHTVTGVLTWIGTQIDPRTRTIRARAEVENPEVKDAEPGATARRWLQAGAFGSAEIMVEARPAAITVPNEALHWLWEIEKQIVFVPTADMRRFVPRVVRKGNVQDGWVEILEGLEAGEQVVSGGSRILSSELSEQLQKHAGDNAAAVRSFDNVRSFDDARKTDQNDQQASFPLR